MGINPVDVKTRKGEGSYERIKGEDPMILGWDIAGIIVQTGNLVNVFKNGDAVFGMIRFPGQGAAYAEYVAAPAFELALKPERTSFAEAAATTLPALTAYQALVKKGNVRAGQRVLIHAASGGVGHFAVQLAKYAGAYVIGTSSADNRDFVLQLGADEHVDYQGNGLEKMAADIDFVLDTIGGENIDRSLPLIRSGGMLISIPSGKNDHVQEKAAKRGIAGHDFLVSPSREDINVLASLLASGDLKPHISNMFPFNQMAEAHHQVESGKTVGKTVVTIKI